MLLIAINSVLGPKFSVLFANNDKDSIIKIVKKVTHIMLIVGILFFIVIILYKKYKIIVIKKIKKNILNLYKIEIIKDI